MGELLGRIRDMGLKNFGIVIYAGADFIVAIDELKRFSLGIKGADELGYLFE